MKKILLTAAALTAISTSLIGATVEAGNPAGQAVALLYAAPDEVQAAIVADQCTGELIQTHDGRDKLGADHAAAYDAIESRLAAAYAASAGTDSAVMEINAAFCEAADNR